MTGIHHSLGANQSVLGLISDIPVVTIGVKVDWVSIESVLQQTGYSKCEMAAALLQLIAYSQSRYGQCRPRLGE